MSCPKILYKYRSVCTALPIITTQRVKIAAPIKFNDPFEMAAIISSPIDPEVYRSFILHPDSIHRMYQNEQPKIPLYKYIEIITRNVDRLREMTGDQFKTIIETELNEARNRMFTFCLSEPNADILMWAHYADEHKGIVVGFTTEGWGTNEGWAATGNMGSNGFIRIKYQDERAQLSMDHIADIADSGKRKTAFEDAYTVKSKHWEYEGEYRCFFNRDHPNIIPDSRGELHLLRIQPEQISEIIFGVRCSPEDRKRAREEAQKAGLTHVRFREASLNPKLFKIDITDSV
jgi:hypothetical protein